MTNEVQQATFKQKAIHEAKELAWLTVYLALFFAALSTYRMFLLNEFQFQYFRYGAAVVEALIFAKVILIGEFARLGKRGEDKPLIVSAIFKAFLYSLLAIAFYILEEAVKGLIHRQALATIFHDLRTDQLLARNVIVFFAFIPLFIAIELRRALNLDFAVLFKRAQQVEPYSSKTPKAA